MEDIDAMFSDLLGEMDALTQVSSTGSAGLRWRDCFWQISNRNAAKQKGASNQIQPPSIIYDCNRISDQTDIIYVSCFSW